MTAVLQSLALCTKPGFAGKTSGECLRVQQLRGVADMWRVFGGARHAMQWGVAGGLIAWQSICLSVAYGGERAITYQRMEHLEEDFNFEILNWRELEPTKLVISHTNVTATLLHYVSSLHGLKSLRIGAGLGGGSETIIERGALNQLKELRSLEKLELVAVDGYAEEGEYSFISSLPKLKKVDIQAKLTQEMIDSFVKHDHISYLSCWGSSDSAKVEMLGQLRSLKHLDIGHWSVSDDRVEVFAESLVQSNVRSLNLFREPSPLKNRDAKVLLQIPSLKRLVIRYVDQPFIPILKENTNLEYLRIGIRGVEGKHRPAIKKLSETIEDLIVENENAAEVFIAVKGKITYDELLPSAPSAGEP